MDLAATGLAEQPFRTHGKPLTVVSYGAKLAAVEMLLDTCMHPAGVSLLQGPALSGKSTIIRAFVESLHKDRAVAIIDGKGLNTSRLLLEVLRQFGFDLHLSSTNELLGLIKVFALQQAVSRKPPLLIIENVQDADPGALRSLCELAKVTVSETCAVKMVLVSDRALTVMMAARAMAPIANRVIHNFHLRPMTHAEVTDYLHSKLSAAGSTRAKFIFPDSVCGDIWRASAGWPGIVDRVALLALAKADTLPVAATHIVHPTLPEGTWGKNEPGNVEPDTLIPPEAPRLIVTNNGSVMQVLSMNKGRVLIGRSEHNDIAINSRFITRHHAMLVRRGTATILTDLNSTNGTFVNSKRTSSHVLMHNDIVVIGHHRIKFHDPCATSHGSLDSIDIADTLVMKTMDDMRLLRIQGQTALRETTSEDLPTIQT